MEEPPEDDDESISFDHDAGEIEDLDALPQVGYYQENIISLKELYLYRALAYIYLQKFTEAIADFNFIRKLDEVDPIKSMTLHSEKSEAIESYKVNSITENEATYNILLCYIALGDKPKCQKACRVLSQKMVNNQVETLCQ